MKQATQATNISQALPEQPLELLAFYEQQYSEKQQNINLQPEKQKGYFAFRVGDINLLVDMVNVAEIINSMPQITPLPFSPKWLLGIGGLRGEVFSVIDLKQLFKVPASGSKQKAAYLVLGQQAQGYIIKVDNIIGIRDCEVSQLDSEQKFFNGKGKINGEVFFRLDIDELTSDAPFIYSTQSN